MSMMRLSEAARAIPAELRGEDRAFEAVSTDTRTLGPQALFVALLGQQSLCEVDPFFQLAQPLLHVIKLANTHLKVLEDLVSVSRVELVGLGKRESGGREPDRHNASSNERNDGPDAKNWTDNLHW